MVDGGGFRQDLYARFDRRLHLPALRERPEDIFAIFQKLCARRHVKLDARPIEVEAIERLLLFPWPSNVRELDLLVTHLELAREFTLRAVVEVLGPLGDDAGMRPITPELAIRVLAECKDNQSEAARRLGVDRGKLLRLLKKVQADRKA